MVRNIIQICYFLFHAKVLNMVTLVFTIISLETINIVKCILNHLRYYSQLYNTLCLSSIGYEDLDMGSSSNIKVKKKSRTSKEIRDFINSIGNRLII